MSYFPFNSIHFNAEIQFPVLLKTLKTLLFTLNSEQRHHRAGCADLCPSAVFGSVLPAEMLEARQQGEGEPQTPRHCRQVQR